MWKCRISTFQTTFALFSRIINAVSETFERLDAEFFYCNPHYKEVLNEVYEKYYQMIKDLSRKYDTQWEYLPFLHKLAEFKLKTAVAG